MGRKRIEIDPFKIYELSSKGMTQKDMAKHFGVSHVTLAKRMGELRSKHGILLKYRSLQSLQLTSLQAAILEAVTSEKIKKASLAELLKAFKVLKSMEIRIVEPERLEIKGLIGYLLEVEKEKKGLKAINNDCHNNP